MYAHKRLETNQGLASCKSSAATASAQPKSAKSSCDTQIECTLADCVELLLIRVNPRVRVKVKITVKIAVCENLRRQHTANLTVKLTLTRTREVAPRESTNQIERTRGAAWELRQYNFSVHGRGRRQSRQSATGVVITLDGVAGRDDAMVKRTRGQEIIQIRNARTNDPPEAHTNHTLEAHTNGTYQRHTPEATHQRPTSGGDWLQGRCQHDHFLPWTALRGHRGRTYRQRVVNGSRQ